MIRELDIVTLTRDLDDHGLSKGSRGAVVHCYNDGKGFEVEFEDVADEHNSVLTLERLDIELERTTIKAQVIELLNVLPEDLLAQVRDFAEFLRCEQAKKAS